MLSELVAFPSMCFLAHVFVTNLVICIYSVSCFKFLVVSISLKTSLIKSCAGFNNNELNFSQVTKMWQFGSIARYSSVRGTEEVFARRRME